MCPGVPVSACATMRPRASNSAYARSPATRTTGLKAVRCMALARSVTALRSEDHISSTSMAFMVGTLPNSLVTPGDDALKGIERCGPARGDDDRRLGLFDQRGPGDARVGLQRCTAQHLNDLVRLPQVHDPRGPGGVARARRTRRIRRHRHRARRADAPGDHLGLDVGLAGAEAPPRLA